MSRGLDEDALDRVRAHRATEAYAKAMRKRKVGVEPLGAEAKGWHGPRRFRLRGAERVNLRAQPIAAGQNPTRLLSPRGRGRRPWPSGAAGVALPAPQPAAVSPRWAGHPGSPAPGPVLNHDRAHPSPLGCRRNEGGWG